MSSITHAQHWLKHAIFTNEFNFSSLKSSICHHLGNVTEMYAAQEQFRDIAKMVCARFRGLTKTYHLGNVPVMVRNAGELPQPFWLGATCGGGSHSLSASVARA